MVYSGKNSLHDEITNFDSNIEFYNYTDRWKIIALYFNILKKNGNSFIWRPEDDSDTEWADIRTNLLNKMWIFVEFWYNRFVNSYLKINFVASKTNLPDPNIIYRFEKSEDTDDFNRAFGELDYKKTNMINSKSEYNIIKESIEYCFDLRFISFLKSKLIEEGVI